jgi:FMN-dependent NADH-azoreductase
MFKTEITVLNTACIEALRVLQHEYSERVKHGTTSRGEEATEEGIEALRQFIDALDEADRIVILQPGQTLEEGED